ncbi:nitroreductase family protein [Embleya sp. NPDC001921]
MAVLSLSPDELLSTTRAVRFRLDLEREVDRGLIEECVELALQAPNGRNRQRWSFVVVTDPERRQAVADLVWKGLREVPGTPVPAADAARAWANPRSMQRVMAGAGYLFDHLHEVPVHVIPCIAGRTDAVGVPEQARTWGSVLPAVWSFMLAARARGLGTTWTTPDLFYGPEGARLLGLPADVMPVALIPLAHTIGTDFKRGPRVPSSEVLHWDAW